MKCNTGKIKKQRDVYGTIYKSMSYNDLVINAIAVTEGNLPYLPEGTRLLIVKSKMDAIVGEVDIFFFLDVNSIPSFKRLSAGENVLVPITLPLLNKYGVTKEQFIKDFNDKGLVVIPN
jgi:hypothetical protein